jgi:hypothetical protein
LHWDRTWGWRVVEDRGEVIASETTAFAPQYPRYRTPLLAAVFLRVGQG